MGLALGGEAGSRLCKRLALPTSPDTILRRVKDEAPNPSPTPRVLGIDDFAFRAATPYLDLPATGTTACLPTRCR